MKRSDAPEAIIYKLGSEEQIPMGEGREFSIRGIRIAVFRTRGGEVYATQAECPHMAGPLADGLLGGVTIVCPFHARKFNLTTGEAVDAGDCALATYPVRLNEQNEIILEWKEREDR